MSEQAPPYNMEDEPTLTFINELKARKIRHIN